MRAQLNKNDEFGDIQMVGAICIKLCVAVSYACSLVVSNMPAQRSRTEAADIGIHSLDQAPNQQTNASGNYRSFALLVRMWVTKNVPFSDGISIKGLDVEAVGYSKGGFEVTKLAADWRGWQRD
jgi:hypothetical protein